MKVSTRIVAGYGVLILLTLAALTYQLVVIQEIHAINTRMSQVSVSNALTAVELQIHQGLVQEFVSKYYIRGDSAFEKKFRSFGKDLEMDLQTMRSRSVSRSEAEAIDRVAQSWRDVQDAIRAEPKRSGSPDVPAGVVDRLVMFSQNVELVLPATQSAIHDAATQSAETAAHAASVSKIAAAAALMLSILVSAPILWSIATRLRELERATRIVAAGKFEHRLPEAGVDEFAELARDFNKMAVKLGEIDQMKKDFVSHVSHDLKGPLASTRETVNLLMAEIPGPLNDKQRRLLSLCLKSAERLSAMIGNLLDISKMEAGMVEYRMESCDLVSLVQSAVQELEGLAREKKLEVVVEAAALEIRARCDPARLTQVVSNLVENAIKFSPESQRIVVGIVSNGAYCEVNVRDRGPGIPLLSRDKVFDRFHQVDPGRKIAGQGVGLGLAICRTIIEAHGGSIGISENPQGGCIFSFKIGSAEKLV